jgi:hypothetical protein
VCISDSFFIPPPPSSYRNTKRLNEYIKKERAERENSECAQRRNTQTEKIFSIRALLQSNRDLSGPNPTQMDLSLLSSTSAPLTQSQKSHLDAQRNVENCFFHNHRKVVKAREILLIDYYFLE